MEFTKKEIITIIIVIVLSAFISQVDSNLSIAIPGFLIALLMFTIILIVNTVSKKIAANYFNIKIEFKFWEFQRYYFKNEDYFKKPFPIGAFLPELIAIFTLGALKFFTFLQFDFENLERKRLLRKTGRERRSEVNESDLAFTAAWGFYSLLILSFVSLIIAGIVKGSYLDIILFLPLTKYAIFFGFWNLLPISKLDGSRLFFGNLLNWLILVVLFILGGVSVLLLI